MTLFQQSRRHALAAITLLCCSMPALATNVCATASLVNPATLAPGIGGTGMLALRPGIGGTGIDDGGIGGTGISGVITGFASICVNGIEVHYDNTTPVQEDGNPGSIARLAVGQVVTVNAQGIGDELKARRIALTHLVIGPVESADATANTFSVLGQQIHGDGSPLPRAGQWVRVSGLRQQDGSIAMSSMQSIAAQAQVQLVGPLAMRDSETLAIAGTRIKVQRTTELPDTKDLKPGSELLVRGVWRDGQLLAEKVETDPTRKNMGAVERVVIEGFVASSNSQTIDIGQGPMALGKHLQVIGSEHRNLSGNQRVRVTAMVLPDKRISVERIEVRGQREGKGTRAENNKGPSERDGSGRDGGADDKRSGGDDSGSGNNPQPLAPGSSSSGRESKTEDGTRSSGTNSGSSGSGSSGAGNTGSSGSGSGSNSGGSGSSGGKGKSK